MAEWRQEWRLTDACGNGTLDPSSGSSGCDGGVGGGRGAPPAAGAAAGHARPRLPRDAPQRCESSPSAPKQPSPQPHHSDSLLFLVDGASFASTMAGVGRVGAALGRWSPRDGPVRCEGSRAAQTTELGVGGETRVMHGGNVATTRRRPLMSRGGCAAETASRGPPLRAREHPACTYSYIPSVHVNTCGSPVVWHNTALFPTPA